MKRILLAFVLLQSADVLTTLACFRAGLVEANPLVQSLLGFGDIAGLLLAKLAACAIVAVSLFLKRPGAVLKVNWLYGGVVAWNCGLLLRLQGVLP